MPTFQEDMDDDRSTVFLAGDGQGFDTTVSYLTVAGVTTAGVPAVRIEGVYAIFDNKATCLYHFSVANVPAVTRGDRITDGNDTWQVVDIQHVDGMWELRCSRMQDQQ